MATVSQRVITRGRGNRHVNCQYHPEASLPKSTRQASLLQVQHLPRKIYETSGFVFKLCWTPDFHRLLLLGLCPIIAAYVDSTAGGLHTDSVTDDREQQATKSQCDQ